MRLALVTDAWTPQVNGVVTTLVELVAALERKGHQVLVIHPGLFRTRPCPGYPGIDIAVRPGPELASQLDAFAPQAIHLATEGPLGWAARRYCLRNKRAFTTAYHTRFPEILKAALHIPLRLGYALFRHFHRPSSGVMVPTPSMVKLLEKRGFRNLRHWTHGVDTKLFVYAPVPENYAPLGSVVRPVSLFVGRASYEKNIDAFLKLNIPGTKVVCGVGPLEVALRERFPQVRWLGILPRNELAKVYASADVFVMPSQSETFGLVMLEAMACGTPVTAYPVEGPLEVLGQLEAGGALNADLAQAWYAARQVSRQAARQRALQFSWERATELFLAHLVSSEQSQGLDLTPLLIESVTKTS
jgi:glycosyltransferase involved in cell wall biosynthesis